MKPYSYYKVQIIKYLAAYRSLQIWQHYSCKIAYSSKKMCDQKISENETLILKYNLLTILQKIHNMKRHLPITLFRFSDAKLLQNRKL